MEEQRQNQAADYWLMQYQRLMESAPAFLNISTLSSSSCDTSIPPSATAPPSTCIPSDSIESSAPPAEGEADAPLAHEVFLETTCVICMDSMVSELNLQCVINYYGSFPFQSQVIFLTCGHLCCCVKCGDAMDNCPMCRSQIVQRLRVHFWASCENSLLPFLFLCILFYASVPLFSVVRWYLCLFWITCLVFDLCYSN